MRIATFALVAAVGLGAALSIGSGCTGVIGDDTGSNGGTGPGGTNPGQLEDSLVDSTRFPRLTHVQWENTVRDLLKLADRPGNSASFTTDPPGSTFGNDSALLQVTPGLWGDYQTAAEDVTAKLVADTARFGKVTATAVGTGDDKAKSWIADFGKHAFRRPLRPEEIDKYLAIFKGGLDDTTITDPFVAGVSVVITAMLQAPDFVYRVEIGHDGGDGTIALDKYEMASRLSYSIWNTMPDDALYAKAESGTLDTAEGVASTAKEMLDDPRAEPMIAEFHKILLQFDHFDGRTKSTEVFPDWTPELAPMMHTEAEMFVREVTVKQNKGIAELLTANYTFVNDKLAPLYGLTGTFDSSFKKVTLDKNRAGFLTQVGFLQANASARDSDPIHRGVFVNLRIICADLPPPPMNIPPLPADSTGTKTMRERIEEHTKVEPCHSCHGTMINPIGFAYEGFDAMGKERTTDHGKPVNTADSYNFEDGVQSYGNAAELAQVLAQRPQVHRCYAGNWLEYAYGRQKKSGDSLLIDTVAKASLSGASTKQVIMQLVQAKAFSHRPAGGS